MITLVGIALKRAKRAPMEVQENGFINYMAGLEGEHRGNRKAGSGTGKRQVTVISEEQWREACAELGIHRYNLRARKCGSEDRVRYRRASRDYWRNRAMRTDGRDTPWLASCALEELERRSDL